MPPVRATILLALVPATWAARIDLSKESLAEDVEDADAGSDTHEDADAGGDASEGPGMSIRQRIYCHVCLAEVPDCAAYAPAAAMLNPAMPPPAQNMGKLWTCDPSERDLWTRDDRFKIGDVAADLPAKCPEKRRQPVIIGKLSFSRKICGQAVKHQPGNFKTCTAFVNKKAGSSQGRTITCDAESLYTHGS
mmetsp:Transcript_55265/g.155528  ORF Transcript_55265/g.155528 Transcript_55265/m.155528 type:complete len:192 (+) Transcript_55265:66-641(+)